MSKEKNKWKECESEKISEIHSLHCIYCITDTFKKLNYMLEMQR